MRRPSGTRQEIRAGLLAAVKEALADAMRAHGVSERELAASCGRSRALVGRWLDPDDPCRPGIEDAAAMPAAIAEALLRVYADAIGRVVGVATPAEAPGSSLVEHRRHLAQVVRELGEAAAAYAAAVADDVVTDEELAAVEREAQQAAEAAAGLVKWARDSRAARVRRPRVQ